MPKGVLGAFLSPVRPGASRVQAGELKLDQTPGLSNFMLGFVVCLCLPVLGRVSGSPEWPQTQFITTAGLTNL